ncbi:hypothetical protein ASPZODRAFT_72324 [Penicilliopsis zonata CBS 506.65]|uniref:FAD dependent oxidoreductase domain-containing protein n=1 Tax=Penicilliopsis zonata CBS 506.65 TaxID=1073090 RepID=A0A1L9SA10_9EURO|nr:hypothetical protein ASPZODRAFT_72324 [Penicilliopsis zonata CBS 506.65]OJJ44015.1 hypothetical protein ASPZODRAFT_72324 [Penicilliopsis zonata CBS 506.65]
MDADIAIVGAGIVGSAAAYFLSSSSPDPKKKIVLIDRAFTPLKGSTGHAPGFVGQFNVSDVLTRLAIDTVNEYVQIPDGFDTVGGLEIATSQEGADKLRSRYESAKAIGMPAELISPQQAAQFAPELVREEETVAALYFPKDGTANAARITSFYQEKARANGVVFLEADVQEILYDAGHAKGVQTSGGLVQAGTVVLATGVWATDLCKFDVPIPIIPVGHPYMYGPRHTQPKTCKMPFVRWPEHHVYARDHGSFYGLGSYNHAPVCVKPEETAIGTWIEQFDSTLEDGRALLPISHELTPSDKFNGIFSMTPDNLPLVGSVSSAPGVYLAAAIWVTHAAGTAKFLTGLIQGAPVDETIKAKLDPNRFRGRDRESLKQESLDGYNNIYKTGNKQ